MKKKDYFNKIRNLQQKINESETFVEFGNTEKEKKAWAMYAQTHKKLKKELINFSNKKSHDLGRVKKTDIAELNFLEIKINILLNARHNFIKHIEIIDFRKNKGDLEMHADDEHLIINAKLTGNNTIKHIKSCQLLAKNHSKSSESIYELYKVGTRLVEIRTSDHFNERGNISVSLIKIGKPIPLSTYIDEERYGRLGFVVSSNEYVTAVNYINSIEVYNTFYARTRIIY